MAKPSPEDVAKRLLILKYVIVQALALPPQELLQNLFSQWSKDEQHKFISGFAERTEQLVKSFKSNDLCQLITKEEREFIQAIPPKINPQQHLNAMWCLESAVTLMWAMGIIEEFPPFDTQSDTDLLMKIPHDNIGKFISSATLLSNDNIERKRSLAELWHWRSRTRQLVELKETPPANSGFKSYDQIIQAAANRAFEQGDLPRVVNDDFLAKGKAYRDLSEEEWAEVRSITVERHHASNWLCGYALNNKWDKTPTDT